MNSGFSSELIKIEQTTFKQVYFWIQIHISWLSNSYSNEYIRIWCVRIFAPQPFFAGAHNKWQSFELKIVYIFKSLIYRIPMSMPAKGGHKFVEKQKLSRQLILRNINSKCHRHIQIQLRYKLLYERIISEKSKTKFPFWKALN